MSLEEQAGLMAPLAGRRCWVVGCGLLGSCLLEMARAVGMQTLGIDASAPAEVQGNAAEVEVLAAARACVEPEWIFCCAATHGGDEAAYRTVYLELPQALRAACPGAQLVFCSSTSVYGGQGGEAVAEGAPCRASSARACLLQEAEAAVRAAGGLVARLAPLYGGGRCELLRRFVCREPELPGAEARVLNYTHRADAARALLLLAARGAAGECPPVVNVCGESFCKGEVYEALSRLTSLPRVAAVAAQGRRGMSNQRVSSDLLRSLGWVPEVDWVRWASTHWQNIA